MAGSISTVTSKVGGVVKYQMTCTSDASGDVDVDAIPMVQGEIISVHYSPSSTTPSDNYDVVMNDSNSVDILTGTGANLSNSTHTYVVPALSTYFPVFIEEGSYDLVVSNLGNAKGCIVTVLVREM
ncbi:MAG: hypothetical protein Unbinned657contig1001_35 [Prokaryotic dsDNA virus sp.]|nr:MAG: hypothetical protein Unbinned657contig1001_35 [Prokaryotic dsDNA virus sp.]|tara:strand:+ start:937 stop:1314 length:378 start_codon:yes stop_codon:yes gene_type:complete